MSLYPTPVRLSLLQAVDAGEVRLDPLTGKAMQTTDGDRAYVVQSRIDEMTRAGWLMWVADGHGGDYVITAVGRRVLAEAGAR